MLRQVLQLNALLCFVLLRVSGGFPSIRYGRRLPNTGPTGLALFTAIGLGITYGFYKVVTGNQRRRAEVKEREYARTTILPFLQAEEDRR